MAKYTSTTFEKTKVEVDGNEYVECTFNSCRLVYKASGKVLFTNCTFNGCQWTFEGAAGDAFAFMKGIYQSPGGKQVVERALAAAITAGNNFTLN